MCKHPMRNSFQINLIDLIGKPPGAQGLLNVPSGKRVKQIQLNRDKCDNLRNTFRRSGLEGSYDLSLVESGSVTSADGNPFLSPY